MNPESPLFHQHNVDRIASEAFEEAENRELASNLSEILQTPDAVEHIAVDSILADKDNLFSSLNNQLLLEKGRSLTYGSQQPPAEVKLFKPHEKTTSDQFPGVEFTTSVVGLDLFKAGFKFTEAPQPVSQMLLFKLYHGETLETAKDLQLDINCKFGATVQDGEIRPLKLEMASNERVEQRLERPDPTEESGTAIDAQVVKGGGESLKIRFLDREEDAEEHVALMDEVKLFVQQRQANTESQEPQNS